jgi:F-type H+-transporting ATPase subunit delta
VTTGTEHYSAVAERYAKALFELANEGKALQAVEADAKGLLDLLASSEDFAGFVSSPAYSRKEQKSAIDALLGKAKLNALTLQFIGVLIANGRLSRLGETLHAFQALLRASRGESMGQVITAQPLKAEQRKELQALLKKRFDQTILLQEKVDSSLLGGMVVQVGSTMIDTSLKTKLNTLETLMKEASSWT